jgi:hypothetical protein
MLCESKIMYDVKIWGLEEVGKETVINYTEDSVRKH